VLCSCILLAASLVLHCRLVSVWFYVCSLWITHYFWRNLLHIPRVHQFISLQAYITLRRCTATTQYTSNMAAVTVVRRWRRRWRRASVVRTSVFGRHTFPDLCLTYGWHVTTAWVRCPLLVSQQANSAFHPFGIGKWVVIHVVTWITWVETIKRQTRAGCGCLAAKAASPYVRA